jgi:hypothetical protein
MAEVLPADTKRAHEYSVGNYVPSKWLKPDGSVVDDPSSVGAAVYAVRIDDTTHENIIYKGEAAEGSEDTDPVWRIQRIDMTTGVVIKWAGGQSTFSNKWVDRATTIVYS